LRSINDNLIEVRKNIFIAKNDPEFLKKYLKYHPNDSLKLFEYAKQLEQSGNTEKAYEYFKKAADNGHFRSKKILENIQKTAPVAIPMVPSSNKKEKKDFLLPLLMLLLFLLLGFFAAVFFYLFSNDFGMEKVDKTSLYEHSSSTVMVAEDEDEKTEASELPFITVRSAVEYYQDKNGVYPTELSKLLNFSPDNWLTYIPSSAEYKRTPSGYTLSTDGVDGNKDTVQGTLSLHFYPKTNQLGIKKKDELLALYPVASGESALPPSKTYVTARVLNPSGGNGAFGTRGLALTDNFAIHGTNKPELIGENVSKGCLRMKNEDIEELFPYIPLYTPFIVENDTIPGEPTFDEGLPSFPGMPESYPFKQKEATAGVSYNWKN